MRKVVMIAAVLAAAALPTASHAQFQLGLRLGYAPAMGDAYKNKSDGSAAKMSDGVKAQIPIQLDAMYKVSPEIRVGLYGSYGFGQIGGSLKDLCDTNNLDCSAHAYRLGVQGTYEFTKASPSFVPWVGVGIGYEWASFSAEQGGVKVEESLNGFEFLNLQVGGDFKVSPKFAVGPYLMYSLGQYSGGENKVSGTGLVDGTTKFSDYADTAMHSWFGFGVVGKFDL